MESIRDNRELGKASEKLSPVREKVESAKRAKMQGGESGSRSMEQVNQDLSTLTFDSICVGENCMNKVEEGAPAKVTQRKRFHCSCSTEESERGKDF